MSEQLEYPQAYRNEEGIELIALNEVQGSVFERGGFAPVGKYVEKKSKKVDG